MLPRQLEPEVMDTAEDAADYNGMDHAEVNRRFAADFLLAVRDLPPHAKCGPFRILDVGTGTALIPIELFRQGLPRSSRLVAIDLAAEMLKHAEQNVRLAGLTQQIVTERIDAKQIPYPTASFDAVVSNSIVHHIPEPSAVFAEMLRVLRPGGCLFVRDLLRPPDVTTLDQLVETYAGHENARARQMFRDSLHAALTVEEVRTILTGLGFPADSAQQTTDRHWTVCGIKHA